MTRDRINTIVALNAGTALEWYDFVVFAYLAPYLSVVFFPTDDRIAGLIQTFGIFAVGYLVRPLGGLIFGRIGDRLGRKHALRLSIILMTIPTTLMALLPTHAEIGLWAAALLVLLRIAQGLSVGGEQGGAICYLVETAPVGRRGLLGSLAYTGTVFGILVGSAIMLLAKSLFTSEEMYAWAWRLPFLGGILLGVIGLWLRRNMPETQDFLAAREHGQLVARPLLRLLREAPVETLKMVGLVMGATVCFYTVYVWLPAYMPHFGSGKKLDPHLVSTVSLVFLLIFLPIGGLLSDRFGHKWLIAIAMIGFALMIFPIFVAAETGALAALWGLLIAFAIIMAAPNATIPVALTGMMPAHLRYTGVAVAMNVSVALFGGTAPLIATWLIERVGNQSAPAWYVIAAVSVSFLVVLSIRPTGPDGVKGSGSKPT